MTPTKDNALRKLQAFDDCLRSRKPLPADVAQWLAHGLSEYLSGRQRSLDEALGVVSSKAARAKSQRNYWLREAWRQVLVPSYASDWARTLRLKEEIDTFAERIWPLWREGETNPKGSSALRAALYYAFKAAGEFHIPRTAQGLDEAINYQICAPTFLTNIAENASFEVHNTEKDEETNSLRR